MVCPERERLIDEYRNAVRYYWECVNEFARVACTDDHQDVQPLHSLRLKAWDSAERARVALARHESLDHCEAILLRNDSRGSLSGAVWNWQSHRSQRMVNESERVSKQTRCRAILATGQPCRRPARIGQLCGIHHQNLKHSSKAVERFLKAGKISAAGRIVVKLGLTTSEAYEKAIPAVEAFARYLFPPEHRLEPKFNLTMLKEVIEHQQFKEEPLLDEESAYRCLIR